jgi:hypothetical protein
LAFSRKYQWRALMAAIPFYHEGISEALQDLMRREAQKQK